ncbi:hypothetical protein EDC45_0127 [Mesocricetibacter intestinalis]|uniref:30S ribosomal protein S15 n=1 Tax=Mesocricetibacter intestinalis TaxID=1521930 RepID=A0A4R6VFD6_9PAST|nr:MazG-like protein [Mesocricetibacter intestinalis]TDQ59479.1 hypothetical protein EDC45_0127 [Mesocricetibacter intestinalis]
MSSLDFEQIIRRSLEIRRRYHQLEQKYHQSEWSVEEDALAFLTDAGLVGRLAMAQQQRWPKSDTDIQAELEHKLSENIWWLIVLADRMNIDIHKAMHEFLQRMETNLLK